MINLKDYELDLPPGWVILGIVLFSLFIPTMLMSGWWVALVPLLAVLFVIMYLSRRADPNHWFIPVGLHQLGGQMVGSGAAVPESEQTQSPIS